MLSKEVTALEHENQALREALEVLGERMEQGAVLKPKSCQYCRYYVQHYIKGGSGSLSEYIPIYEGHCTIRVPIRKGGKRRPSPEDTCPFFEFGTVNTK